MFKRFLFLTGCILQEFVVDILGTIKKRYSRNAKNMVKSALIQKYACYNRTNLTIHRNNTNGYILIDCFALPQWVMTNSILVNYLSKETGAMVASYSKNGRDDYEDILYSSL